MSHLVLISGCSGGGKSTVLAQLKSLGHRVVDEPGRRVIAQQNATGGNALPWTDMMAFVRETLTLAQADLAAINKADDWVFFDRGMVDAAVACAHYADIPIARSLSGSRAYHQTVFLTPPWPEIYQNDAARRHGFEDAVAEFHRLQNGLDGLGYNTVALPKTSPSERATFILSQLT